MPRSEQDLRFYLMKKTWFYSLLTLSTLTLSACGGGLHLATTTSGTAAAPTPSPTPAPTPAPTPDPTPTPAPAPTPAPDPAPTPAPAAATGAKLSNIQASGGWNSWGQFAPDYSDCAAPCSGLNWNMTQGVLTPSVTGNATRFDIGGTTPYADVLWSNPVIGQFSTQGLPDTDHSLLPTVHNFIYDADFYVTDASVTQVLEFDISMYMNGAGMIWGNQCNNLGDKDWDIWDNVNAKWVSAGVPCNLIDKGWNHVTIQVQREADNTLLFQSITLNGSTANINKTYAPFTVPAGWWGITVNYQMDGDHNQAAYTTYLDNFSLTYW